MRKRALIISLSIIILFAILTGIPFINQAFHIDDTNFLYITKQILRDPLRPYSFNINWLGKEDYAFNILCNPPLGPYYSALIIKVFGESERILHIAYMLFTLLSGIFMYFLAKRFTRQALVSSLLLLSSPAFMVMSHTIMPDVALLSLYLGGISLFIYGFDKAKYGLLVLAGIFMGLASLARYSGLTVFFIAIFYALLQERKISLKAIIPVFLGCLIFFGWCAHNIIVYKKPHFFAASNFQLVTLTLEEILAKLEALLGYIGSTTIFFISLLTVFLKNSSYRKAFLVICTVGLYFAIIIKMRYAYTALQSGIIAGFMVIPLYFFFILANKVINNDKYKKEHIFLFVWMSFILLFSSTIYFVAVKHILLLLPALIILFVNMAEDEWKNAIQPYIVITVLLTTLSGFAISYADYKYANVYRDFAIKNAARYKTSQNTVWFAGHWGFQYYMEKLGYAALEDTGYSLRNGDFIIVPILAEHKWPTKLLQDRIKLQDIYKYNSYFPIRTMSRSKNFNFYTNKIFSVPMFLAYYFSRKELETFAVYRIIK